MNAAKEITPGAKGFAGAPALIASILFQSAALAFSKQAGLYSADKSLIYVALNPWYSATIAALALQAVCWIAVLRRFPLSFAYPFMSLVFPVSLAAAYFVFHETIAANHILGAGLVIVGVALVSREKPA